MATVTQEGLRPENRATPRLPQHARTAAEQCPHLDGRPTVFLAQSAPLYGVIGTPYHYSAGGLQALSATDEALPYGNQALRWFLASQMVRRLRAYTVITLDDLPLA